MRFLTATSAILFHIHLQMKIVNDKGCVVPVNTQGELHIRAYSMMLYYLEDEEKTKEFRDRNGWAHTGYVCLQRLSRHNRAFVCLFLTK